MGKSRILATGLAAICMLGIGPRVSAFRPELQTISSAGLRIVVIAGEDAVNIIQQKTAVAPVVEVRDRNDQPVSGAVVTFAIRNGRATFSGARSLTVTTNALGRAVAAGFAPTGSGAVQISATASFQGQTAAVAIAQTNVMTAAQAASLTSGAGAGTGTTAGAATGVTGGAAAGAAAGGSAAGGLSTTATLSIIGAAAAGGATAAVWASSGESNAPSGASTREFTGPFSFTLNINFNKAGAAFCVQSLAITGTLSLLLDANNGVLTGTGTASVPSTYRFLADSCPNGHQPGETGSIPSAGGVVTGTPQNLTMTAQQVDRTPVTGGSGLVVTQTQTLAFSGAASGNTVTGTVTYVIAVDVPPDQVGNGSATTPVSLAAQ